MWDVFVCHASEDKEAIARPLTVALTGAGLTVWYDEVTLTLGDSLRQSIDRGLAQSRYGVVILSPSFFNKNWPQRELDGLTTKEMSSGKVILPVWHLIGRGEIERYSPTLADKLGVSTARGLKPVVDAVLQAIRPPTEETSPKNPVGSSRNNRLDLNGTGSPMFDDGAFKNLFEFARSSEGLNLYKDDAAKWALGKMY